MTASASPGADPLTLANGEPGTAPSLPDAAPSIESLERDPVAIEIALHHLAGAIARCGVFYTTRPEELWPHGMPSTEAGCTIIHPIVRACMTAGFHLHQHLISVVGREAADVIWRRVELRTFEDIEGPVLRSLHTFH